MLINKKVLLIMPVFFEYEKDILLKLKNKGYEVEWIRDRPFDGVFSLFLLRIFPKMMQLLSSVYFKVNYRSVKYFKYDVILAINPITLRDKDMRIVISDNINAVKILYLWDSINNREHIKKIFPFFNKIFSFDPECSKKYSLTYRPLFFRDLSKSKSNAQSYDISFIGTMHSDRISVLYKLVTHLPSHVSGYWYIYVRSGLFLFLNRFFIKDINKLPASYFNTSSLKKSEVSSIVQSSKIVIDIEHPKQSGLTMRCIEALGARRKMVTTNSSIKSHDFYDENNVCIIDRDNPIIPKEFFQSKYKEIPDDLYYKYSLDGWLDELLMNCNEKE